MYGEKCLLETRALTKRFGRGANAQTAVDGVSLHVAANKVYGLLGPNGAGKSTTLKMITGMLHPTSGDILFDGHPWQRNDLYSIGSLIEQPPLYPNLTARENLLVRTTLLGLPAERIPEVLETVDLTDTGSKRAGRFSLGMKQRLGIACALLATPEMGHRGAQTLRHPRTSNFSFHLTQQDMMSPSATGETPEVQRSAS